LTNNFHIPDWDTRPNFGRYSERNFDLKMTFRTIWRVAPNFLLSFIINLESNLQILRILERKCVICWSLGEKFIFFYQIRRALATDSSLVHIQVKKILLANAPFLSYLEFIFNNPSGYATCLTLECAILHIVRTWEPVCISCPKPRICRRVFPIHSYLFFIISGSVG